MAYDSVAISSGHGLYVRGASGKPVPPLIDEVDAARELVDSLADELERRSIGVVTFHDDTSRDQSTNLTTIVNWHNKQAAHDLDISVHFNAYNTQAHGTEVCYKTQEQLASDLSDAIASVGFTNRGGKLRNDLKFLNSTHAPAVLLEVCFCDNAGDCDIYHDKFDEIVSRIADVLAGEGEDVGIELPPETATEAPLFYARGKCSHFGGPLDTGVSSSEGLAFHYSLDENNQHLFLPLQPAGTTGLARRLNAEAVHYLACRWDYSVTPKTMLAGKTMALVTNVATGMSQSAFCADWGPHEEKTGRAADLSPALMRDLGLVTDDEVIVEYPWQGDD